MKQLEEDEEIELLKISCDGHGESFVWMTCDHCFAEDPIAPAVTRRVSGAVVAGEVLCKDCLTICEAYEADPVKNPSPEDRLRFVCQNCVLQAFPHLNN